MELQIASPAVFKKARVQTAWNPLQVPKKGQAGRASGMEHMISAIQIQKGVSVAGSFWYV